MKNPGTKIFLQIRLRTITDCDIVIADCDGLRVELKDNLKSRFLGTKSTNER
jgi:hypothetical protein